MDLVKPTSNWFHDYSIQLAVVKCVRLVVGVTSVEMI